MVRLKELRKLKAMSQLDFAKKIGVAQNTVSNWENENRQIDTDMLQKISSFFNVTIDYLLGYTDKKETASAETVDDNNIKFALFNGDESITDEMYDEVKRFAQFIKERENSKKEQNEQ